MINDQNERNQKLKLAIKLRFLLYKKKTSLNKTTTKKKKKFYKRVK